MYIMNYEDLKQLITGDEHIQLELKKTTGELKDGMHTACAFLNTDGGWLIFGVAPKSLKILGQQVTEATTSPFLMASKRQTVAEPPQLPTYLP